MLSDHFVSKMLSSYYSWLRLTLNKLLDIKIEADLWYIPIWCGKISEYIKFKNQMKNCLMDTNPPCLFKRGRQQEALNWCDCLISVCSHWSCGYCCLFADGAKKAGGRVTASCDQLYCKLQRKVVLGPIGVLTERPRGPKHWNQFSFLYFLIHSPL